jgi:ABC-type antimicrobial peptide transport system permease subunit
VDTPRLAFVLVGLFAGLAIVLAMIGANGVISHSVTQRRAEFGLRVAQGAQRYHVLRLVLAQAALLVLAGTGAGIVCALALARLLQSLIFGVSASDPLTYTSVGVIVILVGVPACYIPARRATQAHPIGSLRAE